MLEVCSSKWPVIRLPDSFENNLRRLPAKGVRELSVAQLLQIVLYELCLSTKPYLELSNGLHYPTTKRGINFEHRTKKQSCVEYARTNNFLDAHSHNTESTINNTRDLE